jgi:hypothetical protein
MYYTKRGKVTESYVGTFDKDKRDGQGKFTYKKGDTYIGGWKKDKRSGQGTAVWKKKGETFVGKWFKNRVRAGTFTDKKGKKIKTDKKGYKIPE